MHKNQKNYQFIKYSEKLKDENLRDERLNFENKWNFFNNIRTTIAFFVSLTLLIFLTIP